MNIISVTGKDVFNLKSIVYVEDSAGKKRMCCNYELCRGPKNSLKILFEGYAKHDVLRVKDTYTFKSLMSMFDDRRIYLQGVCYLDNQFSLDKAAE